MVPGSAVSAFPVCVSHSATPDSVTPWTVAHQAPLSMGVLQARILEWIAMPSSTGSSQPRSPTLQADSLLSEPQRRLKCSKFTLKFEKYWSR